MEPDVFRVLVVCTGNLNRSALGAALLRGWAERYVPDGAAGRVVIESAGTAAAVGAPMRGRTRAIVEALGAEGRSHRAVQIDEAAISRADLVLVADVGHRDAVLGMVPSMLRSTFTIREAGAIAARLPDAVPTASTSELRARVAALADRRALGTSADGDITDPQGKGDDAYRAMAREEVGPLAHVAALLFGMPEADVREVTATVDDPDAFSFAGLGPVRDAPPTDQRRRGWFGRRGS